MLQSIALSIPNVLAALIILAIAFLIGRWGKSVIETVLPGLGFDNALRALGRSIVSVAMAYLLTG